MFKLYFDGASRKNPGPASYGFVIYSNEGDTVYKGKKYIGNTTNNVAEYAGLFCGLQYCVENKITKLNVYGDSNLILNQVMGKYKVKSPNLKPFHDEIMELIPHFDTITFEHVYRKNNKVADALANEALDELNN